MAFRVLLIVAGLLLSGCAMQPTVYQAAGLASGGYRDHEIDASHYEVSFNGNAVTLEQRVWTLWIYRCAELTLEHHYTYFALTDPVDQRPKPPLAPPAPAPSKMAFGAQDGVQLSDGVLRPNEAVTVEKTAHGGGSYTTFVPGGTIKVYRSDGIVTMYPELLPADAGIVFSAQTIIDIYSAYVHSDGKGMVPEDRLAAMTRARTMTPLAQAYAGFVGRLVIRANPGVAVTAARFESLSSDIQLRFPLTDAWSSVPNTSSFLNSESLVNVPRGEVSYVVATRESEAPLRYRFERFHALCGSLAGARIAGGEADLADFTPPATALQLQSDNDHPVHALAGDERAEAQTACNNIAKGL